MKKLIYLITLLPIISLGQVSDATGTSGATTIKNETTPGANTANRVGTNLVNLWNSKGNKQEDNTWTGMQTFTGSATRGGLRFGNYTADPSSPQAGETYYNTTTGYFAGYQGAWRPFLLVDTMLPVTGAVPFSTAGNRVIGDADFTFTGGNTLNIHTLDVNNAATIDGANINIAGSASIAGLTVANLSGDPSVPEQGDIYSATTPDMLRYYNGTAWYYLTQNSGLSTNRIPVTSNASGAGTTLVDYSGFNFDGNDFNLTGTSTIDLLTSVNNGISISNNSLNVSTSGGDPIQITASGALLLSGASLDASGLVYSSTYTPTITAISNIDATTAFSCTYTRVGSMVTVIGQIDADATAAGSTTTRVRLSLPVSSNFANPNEAGGSGNRPGSNPGDVGAYADSTNDEVILHWLSTGTGNQTITFMFGYRII